MENKKIIGKTMLPREMTYMVGAGVSAALFMVGALALTSKPSDQITRALLAEPSAPEIAVAEPKIQPIQPSAAEVLTSSVKNLQDQKELIQYPLTEHKELRVKSGDTLAEILEREGIGYSDAVQLSNTMKKYYDPRDIRVGQKIEFSLVKNSPVDVLLKEFVIAPSKLERVKVAYQGNRFVAKKEQVPTTLQLARAGNAITSSFYKAADDAGLPAALIVELMRAYSYDVDFQRDIKPGQQMDVLFERRISEENGKIVGHGDLKYASLMLRGKKVEIYKYTDKDGNTGYYKPNGESVKRALLKTPVNGARISSGFGMRHHPVLGYSKMHKGIDFAASTGTPIYAAGDGVVDYAGRKGGYGKYVRIKHNGTYKTAYAHMSRFAKGMRSGKRVKQGQVIGYVGTTGRSTGPHLHYEILKYGKQVNPRSAKFRAGRTLSGKELLAFKSEKTRLQEQFAQLPRLREQVAQAQ